jgi:hypothetical protein
MMKFIAAIVLVFGSMTAGAEDSTRGSAAAGQASQMLGMGMNMAMGAMFMSQCAPPESVMPCILGALSFAQGAMTGMSAGQSGKTKSAASAGGGSGFGTSYGDTAVDAGMTPEQQSAFTSLAEKGFKVNKNGTVTDPSGKTWSGGDFAGAQSMLSAGLSPSDIEKTQKLIDEANQKATAYLNANQARVVAMGVDSGGGGGRDPAGEYKSEDFMANFKNPFGINRNQKQAMVAGKTVAHGDDLIGVKVDDIFTMVHRRYQSKRQDAEFIEPSASAAEQPLGGKPNLTTPKPKK